jgi:tRNA (cytidine/uridine-2'-O-)-methyltransferase
MPQLLNVVLFEPEIPPNTGNVARLCAATATVLHLIQPLGFRLDETPVRRAGMDYWQHLTWKLWPDWRAFIAGQPASTGLWLIEKGGPTRYDLARFQPGDCLVFGRETAGLPQPLLREHPERWLHIPMAHPAARSLNLSNCVALVLYEALRQLGFPEAR